jgi:hypothetical protein
MGEAAAQGAQAMVKPGRAAQVATEGLVQMLFALKDASQGRAHLRAVKGGDAQALRWGNVGGGVIANMGRPFGFYAPVAQAVA